jgi:hypothetical protein
MHLLYIYIGPQVQSKLACTLEELQADEEEANQDVGGNGPVPEEGAADNGHEGNADLQMLEARLEDCSRHRRKMVPPPP